MSSIWSEGAPHTAVLYVPIIMSFEYFDNRSHVWILFEYLAPLPFTCLMLLGLDCKSLYRCKSASMTRNSDHCRRATEKIPVVSLMETQEVVCIKAPSVCLPPGQGAALKPHWLPRPQETAGHPRLLWVLWLEEGWVVSQSCHFLTV